MSPIVLLIGGNQGDRWSNLQQATSLVQQSMGEVVRLSHVYQTAPWGDFGAEQPAPFLNQALLLRSQLSPQEALHAALEIERELGRRRPVGATHYSSRPMDIDLIFYGDRTIDSPELQLPHPRMHLRQFVLRPVAEIVPNYVHPVLKQTVSQLLRRLLLGLGHTDVAQGAVAIESAEVDVAADARAVSTLGVLP